MDKHRWHSPAAGTLCREESTDDPVEAMRNRAMALLDRTEQWDPPVNLALIASFRDIGKIETVPMKGAARLIHKPDGSVIQINERHSIGKRNFSAAHDICHTLLPGYAARRTEAADEETGEYDPDKEEEFLCDVGASTLLLDPRWLIPAATALGPSLATVVSISTQAVASLQATAMALAESGLWPCAIIFWEEGWRKDERPNPNQPAFPGMENMAGVQPELRVAFPCVSPSFGIYVPINKSVERSTSIYECFESGRMTARIEKLEFGNGAREFAIESISAPYTHDGVLHKRVVSFLLTDHAGAERKQDATNLYLPELL